MDWVFGAWRSVNENGLTPWYSEPCSSTVAVTYSSGSRRGHRGVVTTDLRHRCTENHTGTSASAPMASALVALALSANRRLSWRDMQHIVVRTARPDHLLAGSLDWAVNGVGRLVSHSFGYGLMDAEAMTRLARNWSTVPAQRVCQVRAPLVRPVYLTEHSQRKISLITDGCYSRSRNYVRYLEHVQAKVCVWPVTFTEVFSVENRISKINFFASHFSPIKKIFNGGYTS